MGVLTDENGNPLTSGGKLIQAPAGGITDVEINGWSIVQDNIAQIPMASTDAGVVKILSSFGIGTVGNNPTGYLCLWETSKNNIDARANHYQPLTATTLDYAVKAAMCDGKGDPWTADEQVAARERVGIGKMRWQHITSITTTEETNTIVVDSDESGVSIKEYAPIAIKIWMRVPSDSTQGSANGSVWIYPSATSMDNSIRTIATIATWKTITRDVVQMLVGDGKSLVGVGPGAGILVGDIVEGFEGIDGIRLYINTTSDHIPVGTKIVVDVLSDREVTT